MLSYIATKGSTKGGRPEAASLCGYVALWLCGSVALWLCSYVAMWLYGYVAMWLCGYVDTKNIYKTYIQKIYPKNISKKYIQKINSKNGGFAFRKFSKFLIVRYGKIIFFQDVPIYFLIFFEVIWYKKSQKYKVYGPRNDQ